MTLTFGRAARRIRGTLILVLASASSAVPGHARAGVDASLGDLLAGRGPDFTAVYRCEHHNTLKRLTRREIEARFQTFWDRVPSSTRLRAPATFVKDRTAAVLRQMEEPDRKPVVITICDDARAPRLR
ncbi:MAG: hypothetical protein IT208_07400 [Chthonomonadales bacterium]|nr:hypothetical protein [Chthonomonadales bacterium]